ncbi:MAG TPA: HWE histidine kinase domain-containing protein, partial [Rhizomicrobium sp.]|nr:HWE histidine kinase domain-containing protein [Rhizomicrobium sp.]
KRAHGGCLADLFSSLLRSYADVTLLGAGEGVAGESGALFSAILDQIPVALGIMDSHGHWVCCNRRMQMLVPHAVPSRDPERVTRWKTFDSDGELIPPHLWPGARALRGETVSPGMEFLFVADDGGEVWTRVSAAPLHMLEGPTAYAIVVVEEIDDFKRAQEQAELMAQELRHRTNNMLARMDAIVQVSRADTVEEFAAAITNRMKSLSRTSDLLMGAQSGKSDLRRLVEQELAPYAGPDSAIGLEGPVLMLGPPGTEWLRIVFHELTTNAVKYGALSRRDGRLAVGWSLTSTGRLRLSWAETGMKLSGPPVRRGFGTRAISKIIQSQLSGSLETHWLTGGLFLCFELPLERIAAAPR